MSRNTIPITVNYEADKPVGSLTMSEDLERFLLGCHRPSVSIAISHAERKNPKVIQMALLSRVRPASELAVDNYPYELDGMALILVHLPKRVKAEIDRRDMSYRQAAKEIGVSHTFLFNMCAGKQEPRSSNIVALICWLQISSHRKNGD